MRYYAWSDKSKYSFLPNENQILVLDVKKYIGRHWGGPPLQMTQMNSVGDKKKHKKTRQEGIENI